MKYRKWQRFVCSSTCLFLPLAILPQVNEDGEITTVASWYGPGFHGRKTASGQVFDQNKLTAASKTLPFGTRLKVRNLKNGKTVTVVINDRGPFVKGRGIDLSKEAARQLGIDGIAKVAYATVPKYKPQPNPDNEPAESMSKTVPQQTVDNNDSAVTTVSEVDIPENAILTEVPTETSQSVVTQPPLTTPQLLQTPQTSQTTQTSQTPMLRSSQLIEHVDNVVASEPAPYVAYTQGSIAVKPAVSASPVAKAVRPVAKTARPAVKTARPAAKTQDIAVAKAKSTNTHIAVAKAKSTNAQIAVAKAKSTNTRIATARPTRKLGTGHSYRLASSSLGRGARTYKSVRAAKQSRSQRYIASSRNQKRYARDRKTYYVASAHRPERSKFGRTMHKFTAKAAGLYRGLKSIFAMI